MKRFTSRANALVIVAGFACAMPAFGQQTPSTSTSTSPSGTAGMTATTDRRADGFDWGLLGLLGLAGLLGLRRNHAADDIARNRTATPAR